MGSVMEGALKRNPPSKRDVQYMNMLITVVLQDLVNRTRIPMMHCTLKSHTVCRSVDTPQAMEFLCLDNLLQHKCLYIVSNEFDLSQNVELCKRLSTPPGKERKWPIRHQ